MLRARKVVDPLPHAPERVCLLESGGEVGSVHLAHDSAHLHFGSRDPLSAAELLVVAYIKALTYEEEILAQSIGAKIKRGVVLVLRGAFVEILEKVHALVCRRALGRVVAEAAERKIDIAWERFHDEV